MITNQTEQFYSYLHVFDIVSYVSLSLEGSNLVLAWHTPDTLIRSQSPFWLPIVWCNPP